MPWPVHVSCVYWKCCWARREGFNDVFPLETLEAFHEDELEAMLCGVGEKWSVEKLAESIKCDHG